MRRPRIGQLWSLLSMAAAATAIFVVIWERERLALVLGPLAVVSGTAGAVKKSKMACMGLGLGGAEVLVIIVFLLAASQYEF